MGTDVTAAQAEVVVAAASYGVTAAQAEVVVAAASYGVTAAIAEVVVAPAPFRVTAALGEVVVVESGLYGTGTDVGALTVESLVAGDAGQAVGSLAVEGLVAGDFGQQVDALALEALVGSESGRIHARSLAVEVLVAPYRSLVDAYPPQGDPLPDTLEFWSNIMAISRQIPDFQYTSFYYDEILDAVIRFKARNWTEHTETDPHDPVIQLMRAFALVGHQASVKIDHVARELYIPTQRLRQSLVGSARVAGYTLAPPSPATALLVGRMPTDVAIGEVLIPALARFATTGDGSAPPVVFEYDSDADFTATLGTTETSMGEARPPTAATVVAAAHGPIWSSNAAPGDLLFVGHPDVQFDGVTLDASGSQVERGVWEYYDPTRVMTPETVTVDGGVLRFDVSYLHGGRTTDAVGGEVEITCLRTGITETVTTTLAGDVLQASSSDTLGQSSPSTNPSDYTVRTYWPALPNVSDGTQGDPTSTGARQELRQAGAVSWSLPHSAERQWGRYDLGGVLGEAFWVRFRVTSSGGGAAHEVTTLAVPSPASARYLAIEVLQGQRVRESVGTTDAGSARQTFVLNRAPFLRLDQVDVGSTTWTQVETFLSSRATDQHYRLEEDPDGTMRLVFGDGVNGAIPTALEPVVAEYRYGGETSGNVGARAISTVRTSVPRMTEPYNPRPATGWVPREATSPQGLDLSKSSFAAHVRSRRRAVTPEDHEHIAIRFRTSDGRQIVERAVAIQNGDGPNTVRLVCVGPDGSIPSAPDLAELAVHFNGTMQGVQRVGGIGLTNVLVTPTAYVPRSIDVAGVLEVQQGFAQGVESAVRSILRARLRPDARKLLRDTFGNLVESQEPQWRFGGRVSRPFLQVEIVNSTPRAVSITLSTPAADIILGRDELPVAGDLSGIQVVEVTV